LWVTSERAFAEIWQGPRLLAYDLDLLGEYVTQKGVKHLVLAFRDSEAFDPGILTDLFFLLR
jgi:origin recognition complex subunit 3